MENIRHKKIISLIHEKMAEIFQREIIMKSQFISVIHVYVSSDFELAKIYLSIFPIENKKKILLYIIKRSKYYRNLLSQYIHNQIKKIPKLDFKLDNSLDDLDKINYLLSINKKKFY